MENLLGVSQSTTHLLGDLSQSEHIAKLNKAIEILAPYRNQGHPEATRWYGDVARHRTWARDGNPRGYKGQYFLNRAREVVGNIQKASAGSSQSMAPSSIQTGFTGNSSTIAWLLGGVAVTVAGYSIYKLKVNRK